MVQRVSEAKNPLYRLETMIAPDLFCGTIGATTREGLHDVPTKCRQLPCLSNKTARISPLNLQPCSA